MPDTDSHDERPFAGIRVVDASQGIAGPYCANILRQYGAGVVKVEPPAGDWGRPLGAGVSGATAISIANSFGKRAVCLDAQLPAGRSALLRLAQQCDVFLENFRPGVIQRLGVAYDLVAAANPGVIYVSITGFGQSGPYVGKPATDAVVQALSGIMVMNKDAAGTPKRIGMYAVDTMTGMYAAQAVMAALFARAKSGVGKRLDISLLNSAAAFQVVPIMDHSINALLNDGAAPMAPVVPSGTFATRDGHVNLAALNSEMFFRIAGVVGHDEWKDDPRCTSHASRIAIAAEINGAVAAVLKTETTAYWLEKFEAADSLCAPVLDYAAILSHPQTLHAGFMHKVSQPGIGELPAASLPGMQEGDVFGPLPAIGAHTRQALADYGFSEAEIAALIESGAAIQA
jgi:crotonobetainyl-CoA:carnitine CoA-transferase CaiB-like acyl-CoA transferase